MPLPHVPYTDAVHHALTTAGHAPQLTEARALEPRVGQYGERGELVARFTWASGPVVAWSHIIGWHWRRTPAADAQLLDVNNSACPTAVAAAVAALLDPTTRPTAAVDGNTRWEHAALLDAGISAWDDGTWQPAAA